MNLTAIRQIIYNNSRNCLPLRGNNPSNIAYLLIREEVWKKEKSFGNGGKKMDVDAYRDWETIPTIIIKIGRAHV